MAKGIVFGNRPKLPFALNALNDFKIGGESDPKGLLASSLLKFEIPNEIQSLPIPQYKETLLVSGVKSTQ